MPERLIIAYLTSQYARVGDTFIRREVAELRRLGHVVHTFSIRKADPDELISDEIRREQAQTEYLFEAGMGRLARAGLWATITRPRAFLTAARTVLRSVPPGIPKRWIRRDRLPARGGLSGRAPQSAGCPASAQPHRRELGDGRHALLNPHRHPVQPDDPRTGRVRPADPAGTGREGPARSLRGRDH